MDPQQTHECPNLGFNTTVQNKEPGSREPGPLAGLGQEPPEMSEEHRAVPEPPPSPPNRAAVNRNPSTQKHRRAHTGATGQGGQGRGLTD